MGQASEASLNQGLYPSVQQRFAPVAPSLYRQPDDPHPVDLLQNSIGLQPAAGIAQRASPQDTLSPVLPVVKDMMASQQVEQLRQNQLLDDLTKELGQTGREAVKMQSFLEARDKTIKDVSSRLAELASGVAKVAELAQNSAQREDKLELVMQQMTQQLNQASQKERMENAMLTEQQAALEQARINQASLSQAVVQGAQDSENMKQAMTESARLVGRIASLSSSQQPQLLPADAFASQQMPLQPQAAWQQQATDPQLLQMQQAYAPGSYPAPMPMYAQPQQAQGFIQAGQPSQQQMMLQQQQMAPSNGRGGFFTKFFNFR